MTCDELSNLFDVKIAAYTQQLPQNIVPMLVFDEYEKSVFLTKAQDDLCKALYTGKNNFGNLFEIHEEDRQLLNSLVNEQVANDMIEYSTFGDLYEFGVTLPDDVLYIIWEQCTFISPGDKCIDNKIVQVIPVTHDELNKVIKNPFRGPSDNKVLRVDIGIIDDVIRLREVRLISKHRLTYTYRYIKLPAPIILVDLNGSNLTIKNQANKSTNIEIPETLLNMVLDLAVQYAIQSKLIYISK